MLIAARVLQAVGGAITAPAALSLLADTFPAGPRRDRALGVYGAVGGLGALVHAVDLAGSDCLNDPLTLAFGVAGVVVAGAFVVIQRLARNPMIPAGVLADRGRLGADLVMLLMGAGRPATFYFLTLHLQSVKHYPPLLTGPAYLPSRTASASGPA